MAVITSPLRSPATSAPDPAVTSATSAPDVALIPSPAAIEGVTVNIWTPRNGRLWAGVPCLSWSMIGLAGDMAMENPMFWASPATAVLTPTTSPAAFTSGPPELPGLMAASVWRTCSSRSPFSAVIERLRADTMPRVTVGPPSRARALPMATTSSPTFSWSESPRTAVGSPPASTLTTARSVDGSFPSTRAGIFRLSANTTSMDCAPATTWLFVTMTPSEPMMKPVPAPSPGTGLRKSPRLSVRVRMDTTAGSTLARIDCTSPVRVIFDVLAEYVTVRPGPELPPLTAATTSPATSAPTSAPVAAATRSGRRAGAGRGAATGGSPHDGGPGGPTCQAGGGAGAAGPPAVGGGGGGGAPAAPGSSAARGFTQASGAERGLTHGSADAGDSVAGASGAGASGAGASGAGGSVEDAGGSPAGAGGGGGDGGTGAGGAGAGGAAHGDGWAGAQGDEVTGGPGSQGDVDPAGWLSGRSTGASSSPGGRGGFPGDSGSLWEDSWSAM